MTAAGVAFGRRLRDARERKGVTLEAVAESTKIKTSLLVGLERGDLSLWPHGIFRRGFVREYAMAIGLQPTPVLAEFSKLFPEEGEAQPDTSARDASGDLRLTLAVDENRVNRAAVLRVLAALLDLAAVVASAAGVNYVMGAGFWVTAGLVGLIYQTVMTVWLGRSAAIWALQPWRRDRVKRIGTAASPKATPDRFQIVSRRSDSPRRPGLMEPELDETENAPAAVAARRR